VPLRQGKLVRFDDIRPSYSELETACKRPGRRRHGQFWHQTCPGFRRLDSHPAKMAKDAFKELQAKEIKD
jgi:hypothetical protein